VSVEAGEGGGESVAACCGILIKAQDGRPYRKEKRSARTGRARDTLARADERFDNLSDSRAIVCAGDCRNARSQAPRRRVYDFMRLFGSNPRDCPLLWPVAPANQPALHLINMPST
jgi:hypothetical protein